MFYREVQLNLGHRLDQLRRGVTATRGARTPIRPLTILGALVLIAIPTIFTIFPEMGQWPVAVRIAVALGWVLVACLTVSASTRREGQVDQLVHVQAAERERFRKLATSEIFSALLRPGTKGTPDGYSWTVYLYDGHQLVPSFPTGTDIAQQSFEPGRGATGLAFKDKALIVITDDAVSDETHGLSEAQQRYFREFKSVVATPIWFDDRIIGVLAAISRTNDGYFTTGAGGPVIRELADLVGVVLRNIFSLSGVQ